MKKTDLKKIKIGTKVKYRHPYVKGVILEGCIAVIYKYTTITKNAETISMWFDDELAGCDGYCVGYHISFDQIIEIIK